MVIHNIYIFLNYQLDQTLYIVYCYYVYLIFNYKVYIILLYYFITFVGLFVFLYN